MWRRPRLVNCGHEKPGTAARQKCLVAWSLRAGPGNGDGGGTWADNATAERREACLPVAREGSCLASVASRVTARHVQGWTSLGAPPIPSLGGRQRRRRERGRKETRSKNAPGLKKTALFDIVNRKRRGRCIGQRLERHRVSGNALGPGRGRASARPLQAWFACAGQGRCFAHI